MITVHYPYDELELTITADACEGRAQTWDDPEEPSEFIIDEITIDGKCAKELIEWDSWGDKRQEEFAADVEAHYVEMQR